MADETPPANHGAANQGRLRLGTRGSPLALVQARTVADALRAAWPDAGTPEIIPVTTTGDTIQDRPLREVGGKGLFTKELDAALLDGRIDIAVHSMKDVETVLPDGLVIDCLLPREDVRDALLVAPHIDGRGGLAGLPAGARLGTASLRRAAQVRALRPDIDIVTLRGNVETRLEKLARGEAEAVLLAVAGLNRLGRSDAIASRLDTETLLPAAGQGAIGIARRSDDAATAARLTPLDDATTASCIAAERAMLAALDGSCHTPIGAHAHIVGPTLTLDGLLAAPDGSALWRDRAAGPAHQAAAIGRRLGERLRALAGPAFFDRLADQGLGDHRPGEP